MARLSAADRWPSDIRELVGKLRGQGATIDQIRSKLQELDIDVPRSTLGREIKELDGVIADIRRAREIAEAIGTRIDEGSASSTARGNIEMLQALTQKLMIAARGEGEELSAKDAKAYSEVLRNLASASKVDLDREVKLRDELRAKVDAKLKAAATDMDDTTQNGKPADLKAALNRVREEVYGIFS